MADEDAADPRAGWATPAQAAAFWNRQVKALEGEGGQHNSSELPQSKFKALTGQARKALGWEKVKIDLYCPDHGVREVERTFTQLGWDFDGNCPHGTQPDEPTTFASAHQAMTMLEHYYSRYTPNVLEPGETLHESDKDVKVAVEHAALSVAELQQLELPFRCHATKKGGMPVLEEKHKHNWVTTVKNVDGDAKQLLLELRNFIGAGGHLVTGGVEIQGQHQEKVEDFLVMRNCLVGVSASGGAQASARVVNQTLDDGFAKKMKEGMKKGKDKKAKKTAAGKKSRKDRQADEDEDEDDADADAADQDDDEEDEGGEAEGDDGETDYCGELKNRLKADKVKRVKKWWIETVTSRGLDYKTALDASFAACFTEGASHRAGPHRATRPSILTENPYQRSELGPRLGLTLCDLRSAEIATECTEFKPLFDLSAPKAQLHMVRQNEYA
jgi:translation initiation factor 1 (eIF-1/SUI1)